MTHGTVHLSQEGGVAVIYPKTRLGDHFGSYRQACEGAKYDFDRKVSVAPLAVVPTILRELRDRGFAVDLEPALAESLRGVTAQQWSELQAARERADIVAKEIESLGLAKGESWSLRPYQRTGISWLAPKRAGILADDMGVGKTLQTLCACPARVPILVVCPANAKGVWRRELMKWRPHLTFEILEGRDSFRYPRDGEVVIVNYDILPKGHKDSCKDKFCLGCAEHLEKLPRNMVAIADEGHNLKNAKAQRTRAWRAIAERARVASGRSWVLTATPLLNRPPELWNVCQAAGVAQEAFGNSNNFKELFHANKDRYGQTHWGEPSPEVIARLQRVMLRRTKEDVAKDLPRKSYKLNDVQIDAKTIAKLDKLLEESGTTPEEIARLIDEGKAIKFEQLSAVRAALATAKIPAMLDRIQDYEDAEEPLVVFSAHRPPIDALRTREGWRLITGDTPSAERTEIEELFQAGKLRGVACTIQAGGVAITLTRAAYALFVDQMWTPGLNEQAEDRVLRIGQRRAVLIEVLVANHPIDERVALLLEKKQRLIEASVEAARVVPDEEGQMEDVDEHLRSRIEAIAQAEKETTLRVTATPEERTRQRFRPPSTPTEEWAATALRRLDDMNPDGAAVENGVGFNKLDSGVGRSLRATLDERGGLSDAQWKLAIQVCRKYHKQVGRPPEGT